MFFLCIIWESLYLFPVIVIKMVSFHSYSLMTWKEAWNVSFTEKTIQTSIMFREYKEKENIYMRGVAKVAKCQRFRQFFTVLDLWNLTSVCYDGIWVQYDSQLICCDTQGGWHHIQFCRILLQDHYSCGALVSSSVLRRKKTQKPVWTETRWNQSF